MLLPGAGTHNKAKQGSIPGTPYNPKSARSDSDVEPHPEQC